MKIYYMFTILLFINCCDKKNRALTEVFDEIEIERIDNLISYFEIQMMPNCRNRVNYCYKTFFENRSNNEDMGLNRNDLDFDVQKVKSILGDTFGEIFDNSPRTNRPQIYDQDKSTYITPGLYPNFNGKYLKLVKYTQKHAENVFLRDYSDKILTVNLISINSSIALMQRYSELDFEDKTTRLLIIAHLFSLEYFD